MLSTLAPAFFTLAALVTLAGTTFLISRPIPLRAHLWRLAGLFGLCLLLGNALSLLALAFLTLGIGVGLVVVMVNVTFYYAISIAALALLSRYTRIGAWFPALLAALAVSIALPLLARSAFLLHRTTLTASDREQVLPEATPIVQIEKRSDYTGSKYPILQSNCAELCQRLLAEGYTERVRLARSLPKGASNSIEYALAPATDCDPKLYPAGQVVPSMAAARADGKCLTSGAVGEGQPSLLIREHSTRADRAPFLFQPYVLSSVRTLVIDPLTDAAEPLLVQTRIESDVLMLPLALGVHSSGPNGMHLDWRLWRRALVVNDFDTTELVIDRLARAKGIASPQLRDAAASRETEFDALLKLMDSDGTNPFPPHFGHLAQRLVRDRRWSAPERDDLLVRIAEDRRFVDVPSLFIEIGGRPAALQRAMPALMRRMEDPPPADAETLKKWQSFDFDRSTIGWSISRMSRVQIAPYEDRIVALVEESDASWTAGLVKVLGTFDRDTTELIRQRLSPSLHYSVRDAAAKAACIAPPYRQARLKDDLLTALRSEAETRASDRIAPLVRALIRMGEKSAAVDAVGDTERLNRVHRWQSLEAGFPPEQCS